MSVLGLPLEPLRRLADDAYCQAAAVHLEKRVVWIGLDILCELLSYTQPVRQFDHDVVVGP